MDYQSGPVGEGGADLRAAEIRFSGVLGQPFVDFALTRGRRLSLQGSVGQDGAAVVVALRGPEALIDAFEITCSLGPINAQVEAWTRIDLPVGAPVRALGLWF